MASKVVEVKINNEIHLLRFDFNALADLEEKSKTGLGHFLSEERRGFNSMRYLLWAGLKWTERKLTVDGAGALMQSHIESGGEIGEIGAKIDEALVGSGVVFTRKKEENKEGNEQAEQQGKKMPKKKQTLESSESAT